MIATRNLRSRILVSSVLLASFASSIARAEGQKIGDFALGMPATAVESVARAAKNPGTLEIREAHLATTVYRLKDGRQIELPGSEHVSARHVGWRSAHGSEKLGFNLSFAGEQGHEHLVGAERIDSFEPEMPANYQPGGEIPETRPTVEGLAQKLTERYGKPSLGSAGQFSGGLVTLIWSFDGGGSLIPLGTPADRPLCLLTLNIHQLPSSLEARRVTAACGQTMIKALIATYTDAKGVRRANSLTLIGIDIAGMAADRDRLCIAIAKDTARVEQQRREQNGQNLPAF